MADVATNSLLPPTYNFANDSLSRVSTLANSYVEQYSQSPASGDDQTDLLPEYTGPLSPSQRRPRPNIELKTFSYYMKDSKDKSWAVLHISARPTISPVIPTFLGCSCVSGTVELDLPTADPIQAVTVTVRGTFITGAHPGGQYTFLNICSTLWSQEQGDPRNTASTREGKFTGKLHGKYSFPYSIRLPKEVELEAIGKKMQPFRLPQTFIERFTRGSIQYEVIARFCRNKIRIDNWIQAPFGYIPLSKPDPPSFLRQLAYQEQLRSLLGPEADPDGWLNSGTVKIQGTVFGSSTVDLSCTLWLAAPLCYTRGSVIPMYMTLDTKDLQALNVLSSPKAINVRLRRVVSYYVGSSEKRVDKSGFKGSTDDMDLAIWWPSSEDAGNLDSLKRQLNGELHLKLDMKPTSAISRFRVEYYVALFPFNSPVYESPSGQSPEPLLLIPVEIATTFADGPRPRKYAPATMT